MSQPGIHSNPLDDLVDIAAFLHVRGHPLGYWLFRAVQAHLQDGTPLDASLGLSGQLGRSARTRWYVRQRNHFLREALDALGGDYGALSVEVRHYQRRIPDYLRERFEPDPAWPVHLQAIHHAARAGLPLPETPDGLRKSLTTEPPSVPSCADVG